MPKVFISYRRSDAREEAVRISDEAIDEFGPSAVFFDTDTMVPGDAFPAKIEANIAASTHVLVVIGSDWLCANAETGQPRLHDADDWVRKEIRLALSQNKTVIPVLVQNAEMPDRMELPLDLRPLCEQNAFDLRPDSFKGSLNALVDRMRDQSAVTAAGIVFIATALAGLLWFFVDQTNDFFQLILRSLDMIASERVGNVPPHEVFGGERCQGQTSETLTPVDLRCKVDFLLNVGVAGPVTQTVLRSLNIAVYFSLVAYGALIAARGYTGIGNDRIFPAVVLAAVLYTTGELAMLATRESFDWFDRDAHFVPLRWACALTGFAIGLILPIRRRLQVEKWEVAAIAACVFAGVALTQYIIYYLPISVDWLATFITNKSLFAVVTTGAGPDYLYLSNALDGRPFCWPEGSQTCKDLAFAYREMMRFITVIGFACLVLPWRFSILRVLSFWVILSVFLIGLVNIAAYFEVLALGETTIIGDPGLPQAVLYAAIAFLLTRFRIKRRVKAAPKPQDTTAKPTEGPANA